MYPQIVYMPFTYESIYVPYEIIFIYSFDYFIQILHSCFWPDWLFLQDETKNL